MQKNYKLEALTGSTAQLAEYLFAASARWGSPEQTPGVHISLTGQSGQPINVFLPMAAATKLAMGLEEAMEWVRRAVPRHPGVRHARQIKRDRKMLNRMLKKQEWKEPRSGSRAVRRAL